MNGSVDQFLGQHDLFGLFPGGDVNFAEIRPGCRQHEYSCGRKLLAYNFFRGFPIILQHNFNRLFLVFRIQSLGPGLHQGLHKALDGFRTLFQHFFCGYHGIGHELNPQPAGTHQVERLSCFSELIANNWCLRIAVKGPKVDFATVKRRVIIAHTEEIHFFFFNIEFGQQGAHNGFIIAAVGDADGLAFEILRCS